MLNPHIYCNCDDYIIAQSTKVTIQLYQIRNNVFMHQKKRELRHLAEVYCKSLGIFPHTNNKYIVVSPKACLKASIIYLGGNCYGKINDLVVAILQNVPLEVIERDYAGELTEEKLSNTAFLINMIGNKI